MNNYYFTESKWYGPADRKKLLACAGLSNESLFLFDFLETLPSGPSLIPEFAGMVKEENKDFKFEDTCLAEDCYYLELNQPCSFPGKKAVPIQTAVPVAEEGDNFFGMTWEETRDLFFKSTKIEKEKRGLLHFQAFREGYKKGIEAKSEEGKQTFSEEEPSCQICFNDDGQRFKECDTSCFKEIRLKSKEAHKEIVTNELINGLLMEFKRRGFETENWDGDEGWEKAIVDGVCNRIEEVADKFSEMMAEDRLKFQKKEQDFKQTFSEEQSELEYLRRWKKEAMYVMPDFQAIGKEIGAGLGESVHDKILPFIIKLKKENEKLKTEYLKTKQ